MPLRPAVWLSAVSAMLLGGCMATIATAARPASGDPERGRVLFGKCLACHALDPAARPGIGPHLAGIVGRRAGSLAGFAYSSPLRNASFVWTEARLEQWLRAPQAGFPGLCLPFTGFERRQDRLDLVAWLRLHTAPAN